MDGLRESSHERLANALRDQVPEEDLDTAAEVLLAAIDGVALRRLGPKSAPRHLIRGAPSGGKAIRPQKATKRWS
jgi:hypothetical protein